MELLAVYDVATDTPQGERRLRRVAHVCEGYGQRVQKSVFECILNEGQLEHLIAHLDREIDRTSDNLRIYRLREPHDEFLISLGLSNPYDIRDPLVF